MVVFCWEKKPTYACSQPEMCYPVMCWVSDRLQTVLLHTIRGFGRVRVMHDFLLDYDKLSGQLLEKFSVYQPHSSGQYWKLAESNLRLNVCNVIGKSLSNLCFMLWLILDFWACRVRPAEVLPLSACTWDKLARKSFKKHAWERVTEPARCCGWVGCMYNNKWVLC